MGTSTQRLNKKIKKILQDNPTQTIDEAICQLSSEVLHLHHNQKSFYSESFSIAIGVGLRGIQSIVSGRFKEEYSLGQEIATDPLSIQTIIEKITDNIDDSEFNDSEILSIALKSAITAAILEKNDKLFVFVHTFCSKFIFAIIYQDIAEALAEQFLVNSLEIIDEKVNQISSLIIKNHLLDDINEFIQSNTHDSKKLIESMINKLSSIETKGLL